MIKYPIMISLLLITLFALLAYIPLIPFMGFYSEDLFFSYIGHFYGPEGLITSLAFDRPFNGFLLSFIYYFLGDNASLWHIFTFLTRLFGGYILFFLLIKLWPNKLSIVTSITLLFLIYPGFFRQSLPLGYSVWIITLTLWILSLILTVYAVKSKSKFKLFILTIFALIVQMSSFLQLEFFIGQEALRLLLITYILKDQISFKAIKRTLLHWTPYVISTVMFILWRIFLFKSDRNETDINWVVQTYFQDPLWIASIPIEIIHSFIQTTIFPFFIPIVVTALRIPMGNTLISLSVGVIACILLYLYYNVVEKSKYNEGLRDSLDTKKFGKKIFIIGTISVLAALIPIIISGRFVRLFYVFDRYTITSIIAVSFITVGILLFKTTSKIRKTILILFISISVTTQLMSGYLFSANWDQQKNIWWQLYWRAPKIKDNAMLVFYFPPLSKDTFFNRIINKVQWYRIYWIDYQIWAPGNLFFNYERSPRNHFRGDYLSDKGTIQKIKDKTNERLADYNITYNKDFSNTIIISTPNDTSCLWVIDKNRMEFPSNSDELLQSSIEYSDVDKLIQTETLSVPPEDLFGNEPPHDWCYYFQKASLARQLQNWDEVDKLKKEVIQRDLKPKDPNEWLPFQKDLR